MGAGPLGGAPQDLAATGGDLGVATTVARGDHVHVYVDNREIGILRKLKGSYLLESLSSGTRNLCVKVVNKAHVPVGIEQCVKVTVK